MKASFIDLAAQQNRIRSRIDANIKKVLDHGQYIMGPEVAEAEKKLAEFAGVAHCLTCASGTDALLMALMAYDVEPGDAIFTTPFTFMATAEVVSLLGATPFFVDIDPRTFNMDPAKLPAAIAKAETEGFTPRGIIPVDLFGLPADLDAVTKIAKAHGLFVLDDACQGFGGEYKGKRLGGIGDVCATSFFPAKPLGVYGDGGALFTNDAELAAKMRSIRIHGMGPDKYDNVRIGINGRFDTLQAAILLPKLEIFPEELELRQKAADAYTALLKDAVQLQLVPSGYKSAWAQFSIVSPKKGAIISALNAAGIPTAVYYPIPLHLQQAYQYLGGRAGDFPVCEGIAKSIFAVPMHPYLEGDLIGEIASLILKAARA
ncbi:MAG: DegT/DnrJ/EryC1/StrS family aminotransferase [Nitrospinae bacterium]|nr:DegT/DnrJ/EryC1/StrS family aminotransferase [Nitrospinota bacterium]